MAKRLARCWMAGLLMVGAGGAVPLSPASAGRNPLYPVSAGQFQVEHGGLSAALGRPDEGPELRNGHAGDWAVYRAFDFDSGAAALRASVAAPGGAKVTVHLDRPDGPVLGTLTLGDTGGPDRFCDVTCPVDQSQAAVRDVYLVFARLVFDPKLDGWDYRWQWRKAPAFPLTDVCNPAV